MLIDSVEVTEVLDKYQVLYDEFDDDDIYQLDDVFYFIDDAYVLFEFDTTEWGGSGESFDDYLTMLISQIEMATGDEDLVRNLSSSIEQVDGIDVASISFESRRKRYEWKVNESDTAEYFDDVLKWAESLFGDKLYVINGEVIRAYEIDSSALKELRSIFSTD